MVKDGLCEDTKVGFCQHWDFWFGRSDPEPRSGILKAQKKISPKCGDAERILCILKWVGSSGYPLQERICSFRPPESHQ